MHIFWQILNLAILIALAVFFLKKPLIKFLSRRSLRLRDSLREVYSTKEQTLARLSLVEAQIENLSNEIEEIREKAKIDAKEQRKRILKEAEEEYRNLLNAAQQDIEQDFKECQKRIKAYVVDKVINYAEKEIAKKLSEDIHNKLIKGYIKRLGKR